MKIQIKKTFKEDKRITDYLSLKPSEWEGELIIRDKISWDIGQMRKFFEGPVCNFIRELYAEKGMATGKGDIREALKAKFLGWTEDKFRLRQPISTTTLDFNGFKDFLKQINDWCMDEFQCGLPEPENEDLV